LFLQTAEAIYKRARKLRRAVEVVEPLLQAAQEEVTYLEEVRVVQGRAV
jgi:malonyl CoA-acyl carrier protein transacylase